MRLLLSYITGNPRNPHSDATDDGIRNVLRGLGWLPTDQNFARVKLSEIINKMPESIRDQVAGASPILISTRPGTWGVVSHENENRVHIRLLHTDLQTVREEAEEVVSSFPDAFEAEFHRDLGFEPEVVIRRFDSEERMVAGQVQRIRNFGFWRYLHQERRREYLTMAIMTLLTLAAVVGSIVTFSLANSINGEYWRGFLDRGGSTLITAVLTLLINMILEYRAWTNERVRIKWAFETRSATT